MGYNEVLSRIEELALDEGITSSGVMFNCPAHDDRKASVHLSRGDDDRALVYCHAGCRTEDVMEGLGLGMADLFNEERKGEVIASYVYEDEECRPLYRVLRWEPKGFTQERWAGTRWVSGLNGTRRVLYNLPAIKALEPGSTVYIVEGEKDADALSARGYVASTNPGGAGKWKPEYSQLLQNLDVVIIPDQDGPGLMHGEDILAQLRELKIDARILQPKVGKDISDHFAAGYDIDALLPYTLSEDAAFNPIDWDEYESPDVEWLFEPYIPTRGRVLVYGKAGSLKSLWVMWIASKLAQAGHKVAYFSLEMRPEQSVARLKKFRPPKSHFKLYTSYSMGDPTHKRKTIEALKGYDMIVIDSWNSAYRFMRGAQDDQVATLDTEFFQPIIDGTGATLVILDNTGHDAIDDQGHFVEQQHARGTSAKQDKMDICIWLRRPVQANNYLTEVNVTKMRYDLPIPSKELVVAPSDHDGIEFWYATPEGHPEVEAWPWEGSDFEPQGEPDAGFALSQSPPKLSPEDRLAMIMAERIFKGENSEDT